MDKNIDELDNKNVLFLELNLSEIQDKFPYFGDIDESSSTCRLFIIKVSDNNYKHLYNFSEEKHSYYLNKRETLKNLEEYSFISIRIIKTNV